MIELKDRKPIWERISNWTLNIYNWWKIIFDQYVKRIFLWIAGIKGPMCPWKLNASLSSQDFSLNNISHQIDTEFVAVSDTSLNVEIQSILNCNMSSSINSSIVVPKNDSLFCTKK